MNNTASGKSWHKENLDEINERQFCSWSKTTTTTTISSYELFETKLKKKRRKVVSVFFALKSIFLLLKRNLYQGCAGNYTKCSHA